MYVVKIFRFFIFIFMLWGEEPLYYMEHDSVMIIIIITM